MKTEKKFLIILLLLLSVYIHSSEIYKIEIYGTEFMTQMIVDKTYLKKQGLYVRIQNKDDLNELKSFFKNTILVKSNNSTPEDFRVILIIYYKNKKETIYIASGQAGILIKDTLYKVDFKFISKIYDYLPNRYFNEIYFKHPEYFTID